MHFCLIKMLLVCKFDAIKLLFSPMRFFPPIVSFSFVVLCTTHHRDTFLVEIKFSINTIEDVPKGQAKKKVI